MERRACQNTVPNFVPTLFQNASKRLAMGSKSRAHGIASKHAGQNHLKQRVTAHHCLSQEPFRATVNRRVPGSSPGRGANPFNNLQLKLKTREYKLVQVICESFLAAP